LRETLFETVSLSGSAACSEASWEAGVYLYFVRLPSLLVFLFYNPETQSNEGFILYSEENLSYMPVKCFLCRLRITVSPFPMWTALPPSEYYELIRSPHNHRSPSFSIGLTYLFLIGAGRVSKVPGASLHACHVLGPRQTREKLALIASLGVGFRSLKSVAICIFHAILSRLNLLQRVRSLLWPA